MYLGAITDIIPHPVIPCINLPAIMHGIFKGSVNKPPRVKKLSVMTIALCLPKYDITLYAVKVPMSAPIGAILVIKAFSKVPLVMPVSCCSGSSV